MRRTDEGPGLQYRVLGHSIKVRMESRQDGFEVQTLIFPKDHWDSAADCKEWASDHDFKSGDVDETGDSWRLRQRDPDDFARLRTICLDPNDAAPGSDSCRIKAVGGPIKEGRAASGRRADEQPPQPLIEGYFAKFNRPFNGPFFKETIKKGAFAKTLKEHDIRALWNHNPDFPLGRTRNNTLRLMEDDKGLWGQIEPPDTQAARDALTSIKRGDVSGASFGFEVEPDGEEWNDDFTERTLTKVKLWEVSPVVFPAYQATHVGARSALAQVGRPVGDVLARLVERGRRGSLSLEERSLLQAIFEQNQAGAEPEEEPTGADEQHNEPPRYEPEPEEPALAKANRLAQARCLVAFSKLESLGLARKKPV